MSIEAALAALEAAAKPKPRQLLLERFPEAVAIAEKWVEMRAQGHVIHRIRLTQILKEQVSPEIEDEHVRRWVYRYHPELKRGS